MKFYKLIADQVKKIFKNCTPPKRKTAKLRQIKTHTFRLDVENISVFIFLIYFVVPWTLYEYW